MPVLQATAVAEVFQVKTIRLTVATNAADTFLILTFVLPNGDRKERHVNTAASADDTRTAIRNAISSAPDLNDLFTTADAASSSADITQRQATGDFTIEIRSPSGTLSVTQTIQQAATRTPPRYRLTVTPAIPGGAAVGDSVLAAATQRGSAGLYEVAAIDTNALTIDIDDSNDLLQPANDKAASTADFLYLGAADELDLNEVPDSLLRAALAVKVGAAGVNRIADADYTVRESDRIIVLADPGAARTLTFAGGEDGQRVEVHAPAVTANSWTTAGTEGSALTLDAANDNFAARYLEDEDVWIVINNNIA